MPNLRPLPRPSIHDLTIFLLNPQLYSTRCFRHLSLSRRPVLCTYSPKSPYLIQNASSPTRPFSSHPSLFSAPTSHDRGPPSEEDTQTDFGTLNVLGSTPAPSTSIDACLWDGFHLNSGVKIVGSGVLLVGGEAFRWSPWGAGGIDGAGDEKESGKRLVNSKGQWEVADEAWGLLGLVWPKPDLLILGLGKDMRPLSPKTRQFVNSLGIRIDIQDTRNAAAQFNLLATERGVGNVAAALVPLGWREGMGMKSGS